MQLKSNTLFQVRTLDLFERLESDYFDLIYLAPSSYSRQEIVDGQDEIEFEEYLYQIIQQSKRCLKETGFLFYYADLVDSFNIQYLLELVFGKQNFKAQIIIPRSNKHTSSSPTFGRDYSPLYLFSKTAKAQINPVVDTNAAKEYEKRFNREDARGKYLPMNLFTPLDRPSLHYTWKGYKPPKGLAWRYKKDKMDELFDEDRIHFSNKHSRPTLKKYLSESSLPLIGSIWDDIPSHRLKLSKENMGVQPIEFTNRIISLSTNEGARLLVPFERMGSMLISGSQLGRKWIANLGLDRSEEKLKKRLSENGITFYEKDLEPEIQWNQYSSLYRV